MDGQNFNNGFDQQPVTPEQPVYQQTTEQPVYQQPYVAPVQQPENKPNGMSIAALVLGIVGIVLGCCSGIVGVICGIVGLILGILGNKKNKTKLGTAGIIVAAVAIGLSIISWIIGIVMLGSTASILEELSSYGYY
ncbi:MAG: DUF4190 domain-containing protein [Lachnospiraceae bacterium]